MFVFVVNRLIIFCLFSFKVIVSVDLRILDWCWNGKRYFMILSEFGLIFKIVVCSGESFKLVLKKICEYKGFFSVFRMFWENIVEFLECLFLIKELICWVNVIFVLWRYVKMKDFFNCCCVEVFFFFNSLWRLFIWRRFCKRYMLLVIDD